ncbi:dienelactone hydrolase family protein [Sphingosinicella sp. BN140058]|uniref:dienelactone hydrolase family protein n=1 Tax=Sphingosinicella sp. BN140058 TaxID=1892855 RepID=UPI00101034D7|nr:dienelactone hydrolase family protein [Sphingosinicella sp. BN140058]QAY75993.1 dienelactone hydrolase family protein [Sphingosinicella sp. BN140058]
MCERDQIEEWNDGRPSDWSVNRRQFGIAGLGVLAACASGSVADAAGGLAEDRVRVTTPDGTMDAFFVRPAKGRHPAILTWPDIAGLREAFEVMARRLSGQGYAVLVVNPYYRSVPAPQFPDFAQFRAQGGFEKVGPWRAALTADAVQRDAKAAIAWLDARSEVDTKRGVGTHGYCMGGPFTVWTAAAVPGRVRAAASLHGGGLVKADDPQSPHALLAKTQAGYLFAIGQDDDAKAPDVKTALRDAAAAAGRSAEVEVYAANHGWTVLDSPSYEAKAAERAWERMSALFKTL